LLKDRCNLQHPFFASSSSCVSDTSSPSDRFRRNRLVSYYWCTAFRAAARFSLSAMISGRRSHDNRPISPMPGADRPSSSDGGSRSLVSNSRLGFLSVGEKSSSSNLLPPRSHSRGDSNTTRDLSPSNMSSSSIAPKLAQHTSPSKVRVQIDAISA
jgi:hypothetical protein